MFLILRHSSAHAYTRIYTHRHEHTCAHMRRAASLTDWVSILESAGRLPFPFRPAGASLRLMTAAFSAPLSDPHLCCAAVLCVNTAIYLPASLASSDERTTREGTDLRRAQVPFLTCWSLPGMNTDFWTFVIVGSVLKSEQVPFWFVFGLLLCFWEWQTRCTPVRKHKYTAVLREFRHGTLV